MSESTQAWYLYLIRTRFGALYTGVATDVDRRLAEHQGTGGAKYLRSKGPLELAYHVKIGSRGLALKAERGVRRLPKERKEEIVAARPGGAELIAQLGMEPPGK